MGARETRILHQGPAISVSVTLLDLVSLPLFAFPLQSQWQPQLQQLRDMGIHDDELSLRALQATGGDIQAALELIFAGGAP